MATVTGQKTLRDTLQDDLLNHPVANLCQVSCICELADGAASAAAQSTRPALSRVLLAQAPAIVSGEFSLLAECLARV